jgi:hypothetical protein
VRFVICWTVEAWGLRLVLSGPLDLVAVPPTRSNRSPLCYDTLHFMERVYLCMFL